jgi:DNA-binding CsgD family transcriptional regulator
VLCDVDEQLVRSAAGVGLSDSENPYLVPILRRTFVDTLGNSPTALRRLGLSERRVHEFERGIHAFFAEWGLVDQFWVNAQDPTYFGVCFIAASTQRNRWQPREREQWRCIAAHMVTAFRVRRQLALGAPSTPKENEAISTEPPTEVPPPEAILKPDGRLEHAEPAAQGDAARAALHRAVLAMDQARGRMRRDDPDRAVALWRALVAGRWSLLDHFDSDGRRFIVAHRNDAKIPDKRGLSLREQQVLAHASIGNSNKVIAYELGLSVSTVGTHLASARTKLNLPSRAALSPSAATNPGNGLASDLENAVTPPRPSHVR